MKKFGVFLIVILLTISCNLKEEQKATAKTYFDLTGYFKRESLRLSKLNPTVSKTVSVNGKEEQKNIHIKDWAQELKSFMDADINKASWKGAFHKTTVGELTTYISEDDKIPVKKLEVVAKGEKTISIKILITNSNPLYTSRDSLIYFQDSLYQIKKTQDIKLMKPKQYQITGRFH